MGREVSSIQDVFSATRKSCGLINGELLRGGAVDALPLVGGFQKMTDEAVEGGVGVFAEPFTEAW